MVATAELRNQFGALLAKVYAPQVIASFGAGQAAIQIRTIPPEGAAAFRRRIGPAAQAARQQGTQMLGNKRIAASAQARSALAAVTSTSGCWRRSRRWPRNTRCGSSTSATPARAPGR